MTAKALRRRIKKALIMFCTYWSVADCRWVKDNAKVKFHTDWRQSKHRVTLYFSRFRNMEITKRQTVVWKYLRKHHADLVPHISCIHCEPMPMVEEKVPKNL